MKKLKLNEKKEIIEKYYKGIHVDKLAEEFKINKRTIYRLIKNNKQKFATEQHKRE